MSKVTVEEIERIVGFNVSDSCKKMISDFDLQYEILEKDKRDHAILRILKEIDDKLEIVGSHRQERWEKGWRENLELLKKGKTSQHILPKYFGKNKFVRWDGEIVKSDNSHFDYQSAIILLDAFLHRYIDEKIENVFEFGCGPAYHLLRLNSFNSDLKLFGLDWTESSQEIIQELTEISLLTNTSGLNFDFFSPDYRVEIPDNSLVFTSSALEQVGNKYEKFVEFLLKKKPSVCINFEPCPELFDDENLLDHLCIKYASKRNYLNGYLRYLEQLESKGVIEILEKKRLYCGSLFLEGQSVIVWKPKHGLLK